MSFPFADFGAPPSPLAGSPLAPTGEGSASRAGADAGEEDSSGDVPSKNARKGLFTKGREGPGPERLA
ncbi:MAG TPA: hypothetical protein VKF62_01260, partial [Planctomycetota bacterium]|nr:hypothetical protein [Planctomycetota bacterium]